MKFRKEIDSMGAINVDDDKYWGASTERSKKYFDIGKILVSKELINAIALIKLAAAKVHRKDKQIDSKVCNAIITASKEIIILPSYTVYIPNTFSPNNDGVNDLFYPVGEGILEFKISIYNRWGNQIYTGSTNTPWSGEDFLDGKYAYVIEIINLRNTPFKYLGNVLLIK